MKILSKAFVLLGSAMILCAAALLVFNHREDARAKHQSDQVLVQLEQMLPQAAHVSAPIGADLSFSAEEPALTEAREMPVKTMDGREYIGFLSVDTLNLSLPVLSQWSYEGLKIAPGRYSGSVYTGDLVICAHNYSSHFGQLPYLPIGTPIQFTDMDGMVWDYTLAAVETLHPDQLEEMTEPGMDTQWDMTLFTCTPGGQARTALRCICSGAF